MERLCTFTDCGRKHKGHGYCQGHINQLKAGKALRAIKSVAKRVSSDTCLADSCGYPARSAGYCSAHYEQKRLGKTLTPVVRKGRNPAECTADECTDTPHSQGLCYHHYREEWNRQPEVMERAVIRAHNRRGLERNAGQMRPTAKADLLALYGQYCLYPGCEVDEKLQIDHIVPLTKGGTNAFENLQLLCPFHNVSKNNYHATDYRPTLVQ